MQNLHGKVNSSTDIMDLDLFESGKIDSVFKKLRNESPIYWNSLGNEGDGFWVITKYRDICEIWKDTDNFTSEKGNMLRLHGKHDPAGGMMMVVTDPPHHRILRKNHSRALNPKMLSNYESNIKYFTKEIFDNINNTKPFDFVDEIAAKLPISVTCDMLGIPKEDWYILSNLCRASISAEDPEYWIGNSTEETLANANSELILYLLEFVENCKKDTNDNFVKILARGGDHYHLNDQEIAVNIFSLLLGGLETTKYAAVGGVLALMENPNQYQLLKQDHTLINSAIEEILRWTTPNSHVLRVAKKDIIYQDNHIKAGQSVTLWSLSANRDEEIFEDPYKFNIMRKPNRHLTFGIGDHYCIGGTLARLELKVLFSEILKRDLNFKLTQEPVRLRSNFLSGFKNMIVLIESN